MKTTNLQLIQSIPIVKSQKNKILKNKKINFTPQIEYSEESLTLLCQQPQSVSIKEIKSNNLEKKKKFSLRKSVIPISEKQDTKDAFSNTNVIPQITQIRESSNQIQSFSKYFNVKHLKTDQDLFKKDNLKPNSIFSNFLSFNSTNDLSLNNKNSFTTDYNKKIFAKKETNPNSSKILKDKPNSFINLLNEDEEFNINDYDLHLNEKEDSVLKCMICKWIYPNEMSSEEINAHINYCLEGHGEEHRVDYMKSLKLINLAVNKEDKITPNVPQELIESCPLCGKRFKSKGQKIRDNHMIDCLREKEEKDLYKDRKRKSSSRFNYFIDN